MICRNCGDEYPDYKDYCPSCGTRNPQVRYNANYSPNPSRGGSRQYNAQQYGGYQQPQNTVYVSDTGYNSDEHVSTMGWIGRWLLMCIPIVNVVMLFVWAFGGTNKRSLKTWARAQLLLVLIGIIIAVIAAIVMTALGVNINGVFNNIRYYR